MPHVEEVIIANEHRGRGVGDDPHRRVTVVYSLDGEFIAEYDEWAENHGPAEEDT